MRILVLSVNRRAQDGLRMRLNSEPDLQVVSANSERPDVVLLDLFSTDDGGAIRRVLQEQPGTPVVALALSDAPTARRAALRAGAAAFVSKHDGDGMLVHAVRAVALQAPGSRACEHGDGD